MVGHTPLARGAAYEQEGWVSTTRDKFDAIVQSTEPSAVALVLEAGHTV